MTISMATKITGFYPQLIDGKCLCITSDGNIYFSRKLSGVYDLINK